MVDGKAGENFGEGHLDDAFLTPCDWTISMDFSGSGR